MRAWPTRRTALGAAAGRRKLSAAGQASSKPRARRGAQAIHPGYGFLCENAAFAEKPAKPRGIAFIGPTPAQMRDFGLKHTARALAQEHGLPLLPGSGSAGRSRRGALARRERIGYPGDAQEHRRRRRHRHAAVSQRRRELDGALRRRASAWPKTTSAMAGVFLEKFVERARHIEVQIFGDGARHGHRARRARLLGAAPQSESHRGNAGARPQRCRRARELHDAAVRLGRAVGYRSAGTVEFVYDVRRGEFYFLEVNTRLQVEHGVTEEVTGIDLVEWMVRTAAGEPPDLGAYRHEPRGHSIQVRVYAEDPARSFRPSSGLLSHVTAAGRACASMRWVEPGTEVSAFYDPHAGEDHRARRRRASRRSRKLAAALAQTQHLRHRNQSRLPARQCCAHRSVPLAGEQTTRFLLGIRAARRAPSKCCKPGTHTTVQDYPGRLGYWDVGVPPSGPMDALAFRLANRMVGNRGMARGAGADRAPGPTLSSTSTT